MALETNIYTHIIYHKNIFTIKYIIFILSYKSNKPPITLPSARAQIHSNNSSTNIHFQQKPQQNKLKDEYPLFIPILQFPAIDIPIFFDNQIDKHVIIDLIQHF